MNNFFYSSSDYDLFKKALRSTKNEPVVINILSDDSSLDENGETIAHSNLQRKQMSSKFQASASPFDKFFGPRKKRTDPLDMKDFSSWKNKNYRESEKQINEEPEETTKFSFSDYLNSRAKDKKYNDEDAIKSETQKSIEEMSSSDENYKKFSLDSYLNKLERQTKAKKDFEQTEDLVKDFVSDDSSFRASMDQDENFISSSNVDVEDVAFGGEIKGDKFAFDREELEIVKARLDKMEREANNIKDKPTTKLISSNELSEVAKGDDEEEDSFDLDKLGIEDDIEKVNDKIEEKNKNLQVTGDDETAIPKVEHKKFVEVKKSSDSSMSTIVSGGESAQGGESSGPVTINIVSGSEISGASQGKTDSLPAVDISSTKKDSQESGSIGGIQSESGVVKPVVIDGATANPEELKEADSKDSDGSEMSFVDAVPFVDGEVSDVDAISDLSNRDSEIKKTDEYITKTDLRNVTDEIIGKFSELNRTPAGQERYGSGEFADPYGTGYRGIEQPYGGVNPYMQGVDSDNPFDQQTNVFGVVGGVQGVDREYKKKQDELQSQLMELIEQNKRTDEEISKKLEMAEKEKLRVAEEYENRLKELEESMIKREEAVKQQAYIEKLKNDIKFKKSENKYRLREEQIRESEKSNSQTLLDCEKLKSELRSYLSVSNLEMDKKLLEIVNRIHKLEIVKQEQKVEELEQDLKEEVTKRPARKSAPKRRSSTVKSRMRTRTPRRKIDSDIIGGINFD